MARALYSTRFAALVNQTSDVALEVPAGYVWIIRDLDVVEVTFAGDHVFAFRGSAGQDIWLVQSGTTVASSVFQWRGRQVLEPGDELVLHVESGEWDVTVSGYVLSE